MRTTDWRTTEITRKREVVVGKPGQRYLVNYIYLVNYTAKDAAGTVNPVPSGWLGSLPLLTTKNPLTG